MREHTCSRCGRTRPATYLDAVRAHNVTVWACSARASCDAARRRRRPSFTN